MDRWNGGRPGAEKLTIQTEGAMPHVELLDLMLWHMCGVTVLAGISCLFFKRWRGRIVQFTAIVLAVMLVAIYFVSVLDMPLPE